MLLVIGLVITVLINNIPDGESKISDIRLENVQKSPNLRTELPEYVKTAEAIEMEKKSNRYLARNPEKHYTGGEDEDDAVYGLKEGIYETFFGLESLNERAMRRADLKYRGVVQRYR